MTITRDEIGWMIENNSGSIRLQVVNGCMFIHDLQADGGMIELIDQAKKLAKGEGFAEVYLTIDADNDRIHRLAQIYQRRYNAAPVSMILRAPL